MNAGWLAAVFSFESSTICVFGDSAAGEIDTPLFDEGLDSHVCTWLVMSNVTKLPGVAVTTFEARTVPVFGLLLKVTPLTPPSCQD
jgi:hypothetical protein